MRKCPNWLDTYLAHSLPRIVSPESYILFTGLFCLAAALRRRVWVGPKYLGDWTCYPHIYVMLVGPAGKVKKTTAMYQGMRILDQIDFLKKAPNTVSQAALQLAFKEAADETNEFSIYVTAKEFSDLVMKQSGMEMYEFLTSMFDGDTEFKGSTISRGHEVIIEPCMNLLAATTPEWISQGMSEVTIGGGFASRVIFLYEDRPRFVRLYFKGVTNSEKDAKIAQNLLDDLKHITANVSGEFEISDEALEFMEAWNAKIKIPDGKLSGYYSRKVTHVHKLAMLLAVSESDELILDIKHFQRAIEILEKTEAKLPQVFAGIGKNQYALNVKSIYSFIKERTRVTQEELLQEFHATAEPKKLMELIEGLQKAGLVKAWEIDGVTWFFVKEKKK